jgi:ribosomal protein L7Ae-like RNA K-turn-binding protein
LKEKFLGMLGLAKRAGKIQTGEEICSKAVKSGISRLIIVACDASENTKKSITNSCKFYGVQYVEQCTKAEIGKFTGADSRAVVSVNDDNFAKAILDRLN